MQDIIGRTVELALLQEYIDSNKSEFVAVYGRRRVPTLNWQVQN